MSIAQRLFAEIATVRYVAVATAGDVELHQRDGIDSASDSSSDEYEELLVNPTVLEITKRRGEIDCGGLHFVLIRYGNFYQYVIPTDKGHISIAIEPNANIDTTLREINQIIGVE